MPLAHQTRPRLQARLSGSRGSFVAFETLFGASKTPCGPLLQTAERKFLDPIAERPHQQVAADPRRL